MLILSMDKSVCYVRVIGFSKMINHASVKAHFLMIFPTYNVNVVRKNVRNAMI